MTPSDGTQPPDRPANVDLGDDDLTPSGHTVEELSDYLDRGRVPADPSIDGSAEAQITLAAMERLRNLSRSLVERDAEAEPARDERWIRSILDSISREAHAGRDIPVASDRPTARLVMTEGAIRGLLRAAGDRVGTVIVGRCRLLGDVTTPGTPITVRVDVSVRFGESIPDAARQVREEIGRALERHTELVVESVDVVVHDVLTDPREEQAR